MLPWLPNARRGLPPSSGYGFSIKARATIDGALPGGTAHVRRPKHGRHIHALPGRARPAARRTTAADARRAQDNSAIRDSIHENFGDFGAGLVLTSFHSARPPRHTRHRAPGAKDERASLFCGAPSLAARHYSSHAELCCVRVARQHERMVRGSISLVRFIQRQSAILTVVQACGACPNGC
jgi:RNase P/RNase MRP subunit POP5